MEQLNRTELPAAHGRSNEAIRAGGAETPVTVRDDAAASLDRRLDLSLEETFPCSDPISILIA